MEFKIIKEAVSVNEIKYEGSVEQAVDSDITLPDYCPDILRILKCALIPRVTGSQVTGDRITAEGTVLLRAIYVAENGKVHCYEQSVPFSKFIEIKDIGENPFTGIRVKAEYVNCRVVSQRRLDVHGALSVNFRVMTKRDEEIISSAEGAGIQIRHQNVDVSNMVGSVERAFPLTEVIEIGQSKPPIAQIIRTNSYACIDDVKVINNKVLIKGELIVTTMYCSDTPEGLLESIETSLPISQIAELNGISEDCVTDTRLEVTSLDVISKADSTGALRLLDMSARVCAVIHGSKTCQIPVITDTYSTQYDIEMERKVMDFRRLVETFSETSLCRNSIDATGMGIQKVLDMWCTDTTTNTSVDENMLIISGTINVCMLVVDSDSQIGYLERQVDYEYKRDIGQIDARIECESHITVCASSFVIGAAEHIDVRIELKIGASVFAVTSNRIVSNILVNEENGKKKSKAALTIYFSNEGENIWDIARKYNTTVEAIMGENDLNEEIVPEKAMLLIPGI